MVITRSGLHYTTQTPPVRRNSISNTDSFSVLNKLAVLTVYVAIGCYFTRNVWLPYAVPTLI
jgi:hypothetical protein